MKKSSHVNNSSTNPFLFHSKNTAHPTRKEPMRLSYRLLFRSCQGRKGALLPLAGSMNFSWSSQNTIEGPVRILCRLVRLFRRSGLSLEGPPHRLYLDEHSKFPTHPSPPSPPHSPSACTWPCLDLSRPHLLSGVFQMKPPDSSPLGERFLR